MTAAYVSYEAPPEVTRVAAYEWRQDRAPAPLAVSIVRSGTRVTVTFMVDSTVLVLLHRADGSYLLDGPMPAADAAGARPLDGVWRRTVSGVAPRTVDSRSEIVWLSAGSGAQTAVGCWWSPASAWHCLGVPDDEAGVAVVQDGDRVLTALAAPGATPTLRASHWARLVLVTDAGGVPPHIRIVVAEPVGAARGRARSTRLATAALADARVEIAASGAALVAGDSSPPDGWMEVRSARSGPQFVPLTELVAGIPQLPFYVMLGEPRTIIATVTSASGQPAGGALVTGFRLLDAPGQTRDAPPPRRVFAAETLAAADGTFRLDGFGDADYEIVAWHPRFGRGTLLVRQGERPTSLRLDAPAVARGRIVSGGRPLAGVDIVAVPDPAAYLAAADPLDLKGGDGRSGPDGAFALALAPGGGGELRIGGGKYAIRRVSLPPTPLPFLDLGDIDLGPALDVSISLDQDPGCQLRATGPIGRSGLQIVNASRTAPGLFAMRLPEAGSWEFGLLCGNQERGLIPDVVTIGSAPIPQLRFLVR